MYDDICTEDCFAARSTALVGYLYIGKLRTPVMVVVKTPRRIRPARSASRVGVCVD